MSDSVLFLFHTSCAPRATALLSERPLRRHPEAFAVWRWWNYCAMRVPADRVILRVNLDETAVCLYQGGAKGNIFIGKREQLPERASLSQRRTYMTHVAIICDVPEVQPLLPQYIICNESTLPARSLVALKSGCPQNVVVVRQKSAWTNGFLFAKIIRALGKALLPVMDTYQAVLLLDTARAHLSHHVFSACHAVRLWPVVVPPKTTWLLQPLDACVFASYKRVLRAEYMAARAGTGDGVLTIGRFLPCVYKAISGVLESNDWANAFQHCGFTLRQEGVSDRVLEHIGVSTKPDVECGRPGVEEVQLCFPRRTSIATSTLWGAFDADTKSVGSALGCEVACLTATASSTLGDARGPRRMLTRAMAAARAKAEASSSSWAPPGASSGRAFPGEASASSASGKATPLVKQHLTRARVRSLTLGARSAVP